MIPRNLMLRFALAGALVAATGAQVSPAWADVSCTEGCENVQSGDNSASVDQGGEAASGDAVGGQVTGIVSSGEATVDARNVSDGAGASSGDATGTNDASSFVGLNVSTETSIDASDVSAVEGTNLQEGDNDLTLDQASDATSGDGVAGQVIGVVTSVSGSADIVADNLADGSGGASGSATATNLGSSFVGLNTSTGSTVVADVTGDAANMQSGDNVLDGAQTATAESGDGVGGQVLGAVAAGDVSIDAKNVTSGGGGSGDATALNDAQSFAGLNVSTDTTVLASDISGTGVNQLEGDNLLNFGQTAGAASGDAVSGQVAGVVTSAGGSADAVLDNEDDSAVASGAATFTNTLELFVGLNVNTDTLSVG